MSLHTYYCENNCCKIHIKKYIKIKKYFKRNCRKAGVFIYDPNKESVLLVQSRGHLFGSPKGTLNDNETEIECAIREVKEETGLDIFFKDLKKAIKIKNRAIYYYLEMDQCDINIQNNLLDNDANDANGITWIRISCLEKAIANGNITLNHYAKISFKKFLGKIFFKSGWSRVRRK